MANRLFLFRPDEISLQFNSKVIWQKKPPHRTFKFPKSKHKGFSTGKFQRAYFHALYKKLKKYGKTATKKHISYITRNGTGIDGKEPKPLGSVTINEILNFKINEQQQFRFRLSPEFGKEVDMEKFTNRFMQLVEKETGRQLRWVGVCHYNTEHPHAHIVVSGVDIHEKSFRFERYHLAQRFRELAQKELTRTLGYRRINERTNELSKVSDLRLTRIDHVIRQVVNHQHYVSRRTIETCFGSHEKTIVKERLEFLKRIGIINSVDRGYQFSGDWFERLKTFSYSETFFYAQQKLKYVHKTQLEFYNPEKGAITGHLSWRGMQNEITDVQAIAIETLDGRAFYCPCGPISKKFKTGDTVSFDSKRPPYEKLRWVSETELQRRLQAVPNIQGYGLHAQKLHGGLEY